MNTEIWRDVINTHKRNKPDMYKGLYEISNLGNIRVYDTHEPVETKIDQYGKLVVRLEGANGVGHRYIVGDLVAESFIPKDNYMDILVYRDDDVTNVNIDNLEWIYFDELKEYKSYDNAECVLYDLPIICTTTGKLYESVKVAADAYNLPVGMIHHLSRENIDIEDLNGNRWDYISKEFYDKNKEYSIITRIPNEKPIVTSHIKQRKRRVTKESKTSVVKKKPRAKKSNKRRHTRYRKSKNPSGYSMYRSRLGCR